MSRKQHTNAKLAGYDGPFFPELAKELQDVLEHLQDIYSHDGLSLAASTLPYSLFVSRSKTSDGYTWYWSLGFHRDEGVVMVLFPWWADLGYEDKSLADRSIAVHTAGEYSDSIIQSILEGLIGRVIELSLRQNPMP